ncbi:hypothetical protein RB653_007661 [Dictyostelium firmibasis]|uniref:Uncharacterized protein n=1 Tax=Dictyostelium firmibasis TaxID=79012 RepID=A0AAN7YUV1_9MYCE
MKIKSLLKIKNTLIFISIYIVFGLIKVCNCIEPYDSYDNSSDNDGNNNNNKYYNYEKNLAYVNHSFVKKSINSKPNLIYFTYKIDSYSYGYIGTNEIKNNSATHIGNAHIPIDDLSIPFEMVMTKSYNTMIVTGFSDTKKNKYNGCHHYFDYGDIRVEDCKMWVNLIDISQNQRLSHYSIIYDNEETITTTKNSHTMVGMGFNIENDTFSIVTSTDKFHINGSTYSNSNQSLNYYSTSILINPDEIDTFKKSHDKKNNIYYSYIKEPGTEGNHYLVSLNLNTNQLTTKMYKNNEKLQFSTIGISIWNDKFIMAGTPQKSNSTNIYSISKIITSSSSSSSSLSSSSSSSSTIENDDIITTFLYTRPYLVNQYVKSENTQYFMFYNKGKTTLTIIDLENNDIEDYKISFKMKIPEYAHLVELYSFYQDPSHINPTVTDGWTSGKLFITIFYPVFGAFLISSIAICLTLAIKKARKRRLLQRQEPNVNLKIVKTQAKEDEEERQKEKEEKHKLFLQTQKEIQIELNNMANENYNISNKKSDNDEDSSSDS